MELVKVGDRMFNLQNVDYLLKQNETLTVVFGGSAEPFNLTGDDAKNLWDFLSKTATSIDKVNVTVNRNR